MDFLLTPMQRLCCLSIGVELVTLLVNLSQNQNIAIPPLEIRNVYFLQ